MIRHRRRLGLWCAALATVGIALPASGAAAGAQADLAATAADRLEELGNQRIEGLTPLDVLLRNLARYFVAYPVAAEAEELSALLGVCEELARRYLVAVVQAAVRAQPPGGDDAAPLSAEAVATAAALTLPRRPTPWDETVFLPDRQDGGTVIERWDLEAFAATGFGWQVVLSLAAQTGPATLPALGPQAAERLAGEAAAIGLLLLRRAGELARRERAEAVRAVHVQTAAQRLQQPAMAPDRQAPPAVDPPFTDVTAASGVEFRHVSSDWLARWRRFGPLAPSFSGGGLAAGDLDGDGWPDLVVCGGQGCRAFRNLGGMRFTDVTERLGIGAPCEARTPLIADFDNDGWRDLYTGCARDPDRLYRGLPDGSFADATAGAGLDAAAGISGPATAFDGDGDGLLDLYVGYFGNYLAGESPFRPGDNRNGQPDRYFRNLGGLRFEDVSAAAGVGSTGWAQAVSHTDVDLDGDQDVYVANDFGRNELLLNRGDGSFEPAPEDSGAADPNHGMNVAFADLNADLLPDIFITNIWSLEPRRLELVETNSLLLSRDGPARPRFTTADDPALAAIDTGWSWAALFLDFDHDADDDLFLVNGFTDYWTTFQYRAHPEQPGRRYAVNNGRDANRLLVSDGGLPTRPVASGAEMAEANSRGLALADFDLDGDVDLAVSAFHGPARLFRNELPAGRHWLAVELLGATTSAGGRDAFGAVVLTRLPGRAAPIWRQVTGGEGYLSMSTPAVELGLGASSSATLELRWPDGRRQRLETVTADRRLRIRHPAHP